MHFKKLGTVAATVMVAMTLAACGSNSAQQTNGASQSSSSEAAKMAKQRRAKLAKQGEKKYPEEEYAALAVANDSDHLRFGVEIGSDSRAKVFGYLKPAGAGVYNFYWLPNYTSDLASEVESKDPNVTVTVNGNKYTVKNLEDNNSITFNRSQLNGKAKEGPNYYKEWIKPINQRNPDDCD